MIELERAFFDEMVEHGLAAFPNEACGLLAGKEGRPVKFFAMVNADASPVSYRLDDGVKFIHLATFETPDDNPLTRLAAFKAFQKDIGDRCVERPVVTELTSVVGSYGGVS